MIIGWALTGGGTPKGIGGGRNLEEAGSNAAEALFNSGDVLIAPHYFLIEVTQVLWTATRRGRIPASMSDLSFRKVLDFPIDFAADSNLLRPAREIAYKFDIAIYDCLYVALAVERSAELATADDALGAKLRKARVPGLKVRLI